MSDYTEISVPNQITGDIKNIVSSFDFYVRRNRALIDLLYSKGITQQEIANYIGVTKAAISLQYPKGGNK